MSKPRLSIAALTIRIVTIGFGVALVVGQTGSLATAAGWFGLLAPAFFLWALWATSGVWTRMNRGEAFGPAMIRGLKEIGTGLMLGAFSAIVVQPSLIFLSGNGFTEMRGVRFNLDIENLTLALVGLVLIMLARAGAQLKSSLEEFV